VALSIEDLLKMRPVDKDVLDRHRNHLLSEVRAYRLRELREALEVTQTQLAEVLQVSQKRVSEIERGEVDRTQVDTLRRYVTALGGTLRIEVEVGETRIHIA
jgi:predicted transcriptional regulator